jgi:hypothetical protein
LALLLAGCAAAHRPGAAARAASSLPTAPTTTTTTATNTTLDPGWLPQTDVLPSSATAQFEAEMAALWEGVVSDSPAIAMAAFFPESAYLQVKTIPDPAADFENRLVAEYALDIGAAHDLLGAEPAGATLVGVLVPTQDAHWVPPGTCSNAVGYYEVANSRVVYRLGDAERSFGIASLISWRGVWYVVHLGAIVRSGTAGEVDDPSSGPGTSAPSTSC